MAQRSIAATALRAAALAMGFVTTAALAQMGGEAPDDAPMRGDFELMLGAGVANQPAYLGDDHRRTSGLPLVSARWSNGWFAGVGGIGYRFGDRPFSGGLRVGYDFGRDESDSPHLRGMGNVHGRPEIGGFASWSPLPPVATSVSLRYGSGNDHDGLVADLQARGMVPIDERHRVVASLGATVVNGASMRSLFGVDTEQSLRSGYPVYRPGGGLRDVNARLGYAWSPTEQSMIQGGVDVRRLLGDARDSPLTRKPTGVGVMLVAAYRW